MVEDVLKSKMKYVFMEELLDTVIKRLGPYGLSIEQGVFLGTVF